MGFHNRAVADLFKGMALAMTSEEPPSPSPCEGDQGNPRLIITTLDLPFHKEECKHLGPQGMFR